MDDINNYYLDDIDQIQSAADTTSAKKETKEAYYKIKELQDEYTGKKDSWGYRKAIAAIATQYLKKIASSKELNDGIDYSSLGSYLRNIDTLEHSDLRMYCILFLLEGSISRRPSFDPNAVVDPDAEISWKNRLKIFYDTYLLEHSVGNALLYDSNGAVLGKCVFSGDSGDHEALHFGSGKNAADFNLLDVNTGIMSGQVEFKHWGNSVVERAKEYYEKSSRRYGARYVLVYFSNKTYKLIDYLFDIVIDQPQLKPPVGLLYWR